MGFQSSLTGALLDHIFGKAVYTPPTIFYIALSTTTGVDAPNEVSGGGYARQPLLASDWNPADTNANAFITNNSSITFPAATAAWGTVKEALLCDDLTGGNILGRADGAIDKSIASGDTVIILADNLKFILI